MDSTLTLEPVAAPTAPAATARTRRAWALALAYSVAVSLLHLEFSLWLVKTRVDASGAVYSHRTYFPYVLGAIVVLSLIHI